MIKKVRIRNYKCYGDRPADFDLARINFIYGDNSVGKSTFLQCLSHIYHMYDGGEQSIPKSDVLDKRSFKREGSEKIDIRVKTDEDMVWQGKVLDGRFALRDGNGEIVNKSDFFAAVPWLRHAEAPRVLRSESKGNKLEELAEKMIDTDEVNRMFEFLGIGYKCTDKYTLEDTVLGIDDISVDDVGTGIEVLFYILQSIVFWQKGILLLEEPEGNVNERQLKSLTRLLVDEARNRFDVGGQLVVECHSEHILLALMSLVSQGHISADDIAVFYVTKNADGSLVKLCRMDEKGTLDQWPDSNGFFTARHKILFGDDE